MDNPSEYVPIKKKAYITKLIKLEAENKYLRKKLRIYEDIVHSRILNKHKFETKKNNFSRIHDPQFDAMVKSFLTDPNQSHDGLAITNYFLGLHEIIYPPDKSDVISFLHYF